MQQFFSLLFWRLFTAQHVSGVFPPIIRSSMTAVAASGFTFESWWQSCCVRGRAGTIFVPGTIVPNVPKTLLRHSYIFYLSVIIFIIFWGGSSDYNYML